MCYIALLIYLFDGNGVKTIILGALGNLCVKDAVVYIGAYGCTCHYVNALNCYEFTCVG